MENFIGYHPHGEKKGFPCGECGEESFPTFGPFPTIRYGRGGKWYCLACWIVSGLWQVQGA